MRKNEDSWRWWYKELRKLGGRKLRGVFGGGRDVAALLEKCRPL